jgi:hypothetical protein
MASKKRNNSKKNIKKLQKNQVKHEKLHSTFWVVLTSFLLISVITIIFSSGGITGNAVASTIQKIHFLEAEESLILEPNVENLGLITLDFDKDVKNGLFEIRGADLKFDGTKLSAFSVLVNPEPVSMKLILKISEEDITALGLMPTDIYVYGAQKLDTRLTEKDRGYVFYEVDLPSVGKYAIGKANEKKAIAGLAVDLPEVEPTQEELVEEIEVVEEEPVAKKEFKFFSWLKGLFS